ncbi:hypothetical protein KR200_011977, partial [Drosophila serrata]
IAFIKEYIDLGHMSPSCKQSALPQYYLPHHCVHKLDSSTTKLRVVFDGSAKSSCGYSLNELLFAGPSIQPKIFSTLVRFRFFKVALCGDICKMYRCVRVSEPDNLLQCILWRDSDSIEEVVYIRQQVKSLLAKGLFPIRKWCSNEPAALEGELEADREKM